MLLRLITGIFGGGNRSGSSAIGIIVKRILGISEPNEAAHQIHNAHAINAIEADSPSMFIAGWRPFLGWILSISAGVYFIPQFAMASYVWTRACILEKTIVEYPAVDSMQLFILLGSLLGIAVNRGIEKDRRENRQMKERIAKYDLKKTGIQDDIDFKDVKRKTRQEYKDTKKRARFNRRMDRRAKRKASRLDPQAADNEDNQ